MSDSGEFAALMRAAQDAGDGWGEVARLAGEVLLEGGHAAAVKLAQAGLCSHGGHGWDGETCSDIPAMSTDEEWWRAARERGYTA